MRIYLTSLLLSLIIMLSSTVVNYNIIDCLDPPVPSDGHHYMPNENIANSLFLSFVLGAVVFISAVRIQRQPYRK
ncbi:hypothetical protein C8D70_1137 [Chryseobacterium sp. CBTAP 102]|uniref:hypothetical protein n=1 Tax=Chryseobacterium sp. CBTAP 102 TaxID=2135644 RepID=UPI000D8AAC06|nr:hypothetical protein [Chryseobacterium sp. CBTAP 102]PXW10684.1 hypothetical protein C8D70_1137 [Chryseobacterium sp. CBTAP 102]